MVRIFPGGHEQKSDSEILRGTILSIHPHVPMLLGFIHYTIIGSHLPTIFNWRTVFMDGLVSITGSNGGVDTGGGVAGLAREYKHEP